MAIYVRRNSYSLLFIFKVVSNSKIYWTNTSLYQYRHSSITWSIECTCHHKLVGVAHGHVV